MIDLPFNQIAFYENKQCQIEQVEELNKAIRQNLEVLGYGEVTLPTENNSKPA